jgi:hypothetical protein
MQNELEHLRQLGPLYSLLHTYHERAAGDRQAWQDRVQDVDGVGGRELVRLHGELLAYGWIEQNTGVTATPCYRITAVGIRALRQAREEEPAPA